MKKCIVCDKDTVNTFGCPCDLDHPICEGNHVDIVPRLDCAFIRGGRGCYTTRTGRG